MTSWWSVAAPRGHLARGPDRRRARGGGRVRRDVTDLQAGVINAAAAGHSAAVAINADLVGDDVRLAVTVHAREGIDDRGARATTAAPFSALVEAAVSERVLGARRHGL
jgi:hypothetical protein